MLLSYVTSVSVFSERLHIISSVQWESKWNSCIQTCLFEFLPCWEDEICLLLCLSPGYRLYLHVKQARLGEASPLEGGGRSLGPCYNASQQSSPLDTVDDAPQWQSHFIPVSIQYSVYTNPFELAPPTKGKRNWLNYLLSVEPSPISGTRWKKGKSGRATVLSRELTECLHRQLYTLPADDILTSFYRPLEDSSESWGTLLSVMWTRWKKKSRRRTEADFKWKINPFSNNLCCFCCIYSNLLLRSSLQCPI